MSNPQDPNQPPPFQPQPWGSQPPAQQPGLPQQQWPGHPQGGPQQPWTVPGQYSPPGGGGYYGAPPPKNHTVRNVILGIVGAIVAIIVLAAACSGPDSKVVSNGSGSAATAGGGGDDGVGKFGATIEVPHNGNTAQVTVGAPRQSADQSWAPDGTAQWELEVVVVVKKGTWRVNPLNFEARTAAGLSLNTGMGDTLGATEAKAGETVKGLITYNVPQGDTIAKILMEAGLSDRVAEWDA